VGECGERRLCREEYRVVFSALRSFFFCPPFLKLLFATGTRCFGKEGEWWGVGLLLCILRGGFFLGFRDEEAFFLFLLAYKLGLKKQK